MRRMRRSSGTLRGRPDSSEREVREQDLKRRLKGSIREGYPSPIPSGPCGTFYSRPFFFCSCHRHPPPPASDLDMDPPVPLDPHSVRPSSITLPGRPLPIRTGHPVCTTKPLSRAGSSMPERSADFPARWTEVARGHSMPWHRVSRRSRPLQPTGHWSG